MTSTLFSSIRKVILEIYNDFQSTNPNWISNYFFAEQLYGENKLIVFSNNSKSYSFNFSDNLGNYFYIRSLDGFINYNEDLNKFQSCIKNYNISMNLRLVFLFESIYNPFILEKKIRQILNNNGDITISKFTYSKNLIAIEEIGALTAIQPNINIIAFDFVLNINENEFVDTINNINGENVDINCAIPLCTNCTSEIGKYLDKWNTELFNSSEY